MGRKFIDLTGQRFNKLVVTKRIKNDKWGHSKWVCKCDCGNEVIVISIALKTGNTRSCGCIRTQDLIGKRFNRLVVLKRVEKVGKQTTWLCKCDCENTKVISGTHLKSGNIQSCGCIRAPNLTGKRFGKLIVIEKAPNTNAKESMWLCLCDCGNTKVIRRNLLVREQTKSCGCLRKEISKLSMKDRIKQSKIYKAQANLGNISNISWNESLKIVESVINITIGSLK